MEGPRPLDSSEPEDEEKAVTAEFVRRLEQARPKMVRGIDLGAYGSVFADVPPELRSSLAGLLSTPPALAFLDGWIRAGRYLDRVSAVILLAEHGIPLTWSDADPTTPFSEETLKGGEEGVSAQGVYETTFEAGVSILFLKDGDEVCPISFGIWVLRDPTERIVGRRIRQAPPPCSAFVPFLADKVVASRYS